jgi:8-oxo-dGTP diphosphatase
MQDSIRRRFPLFFDEGTFEIHVESDNENNQEAEVTIKKTKIRIKGAIISAPF